MTIAFTKMQALGNDFMVINAINAPLTLNNKQIKALGRRDTGVGFDQLLVVEKSLKPDFDFLFRFFNADGYEIGQCGNGARCLALFIKMANLTDKNHFKVYTKTTQLALHIHSDQTVSVDMGLPMFNPKTIPFLASEQADRYIIKLADANTCELHALFIGNPHAVIKVNKVDEIAVDTLGPQISKHPLFPEQTNVSFMELCNHEQIKLRVYERGCGETKACGSAAVAAAAIGCLYYDLSKTVRVSLPGGDLLVQWPAQDASLVLTGSANFVYEGRLAF